MPKISVIVPVYNVEKYLGQCIDSILSQTYTDFELLLIDDGSTDKSPLICDNYVKSDRRIKVFHVKNGGVSKARNIGLDNITGDFVTFVDSDDWIERNFFENAMLMIEKYHLDVFAGGARGCTIAEDVRIDTNQFIPIQAVLLLQNWYLSPCWGKIYSVTAISETRFNEKQNWGEDLCFIHSLLCKSLTVYASASTVYNHRHTPGSLITIVSVEKCQSVILTYTCLFDFIERKRWENSEYHTLVKKRCLEDVTCIQNMILAQSCSYFSKRRMLKILHSNKKILDVLYENTRGTRLGVINLSPDIILLRAYIKQKR